MTAFRYHDGVLHAEALPLDRLAEAVGTPFFCYSSEALEQAYDEFAAALSGLDATICYALKANSNQAVIRTFALKGCGADIVSGGELRRALAAGIPAGRIVFAGVGKSAAEIAEALDAGVWQFNVESLQELAVLAGLAEARGVTAPVALRVNPHVDALTHAKITTATPDSKFGIDLGQLDQAIGLVARHANLELQALAVHIGSQVTEAGPFERTCERLAQLYSALQATTPSLSRLDLGGGLGIAYRGDDGPDIARYAATVKRHTAGLKARLIFEPGRRLVGNAGLLLTRVLYTKLNGERRIVVVDAAMNDLIRPTLYDAWHEIITVAQPGAGPGTEQDNVPPADIVGPVCEPSDTFARQRPLPEVEPGALLAICSSGAYGAVMASSYNTRLLAPEVMVRGGSYAIVRPRPDYAALIGQDRLPDWLEAPKEADQRGIG